MTLLGDAAVAMWWNVDEQNRVEFHEWHSKEHLPERLGIPGFRRGSRWKSAEEGAYFVLYELESYDTLTSPPYLSRLNDPTPWSTKMMPLHRGMVRSQCRILETSGYGLATFMHTVRLSPLPGREGELRAFLSALVKRAPHLPGLTSAHLLRTETPATKPTREQEIRGGDAAADWILLVSGHTSDPWSSLLDGAGMENALDRAGAGNVALGEFSLMHAVTANDVETVGRRAAGGAR
ncbi:DUF4286 family protein [Devosia rhizoryzae]|uniref:Uncharacterized protein n=1 Tax=Devosia rhizoryzae TaxID=2774137 RepID=A0ABX7C6Z0_9HYPH|nr:DUF4286 family protein [Devosia rhizoryzae]QQR40024.1 hypothetical protein JI748_03120 [Devosia rhizoryzae]